MKTWVISVAAMLNLFCALTNLKAQSGGPTVDITSPDPTAKVTVINEAEQTTGISLVAQATPASGAGGACLTFDWKDQYGGDWGGGTLSSDGLTSTLTYWPSGSAYGSPLTMKVTVQDNINPVSAPATIDLTVPTINTGTINALSYYDDYVYTPNATPTGNEQTSMQAHLFPSVAQYASSWSQAGNAILATADDDDASYCTVSSIGYSTNTGDQDLQVLDGDGNVAADLALTVTHPTSYAIGASATYTALGGTGSKGYIMSYPDTLYTQFPNQPYFEGTPITELFPSSSGSWAWYVGNGFTTAFFGAGGTYPGAFSTILTELRQMSPSVLRPCGPLIREQAR